MTHEHQPDLPPDHDGLSALDRANNALADELAAARNEVRGVDDDTLRILARHVLDHARPAPGLTRLLRGDAPNLYDLENDYFHVATDPRTPPTVRNALDWIATTALLREHPDVALESVPLSFLSSGRTLVADQFDFEGTPIVFRRQAVLPDSYRDHLVERLIRDLSLHGTPLLAYLTLSDVDADDRDLVVQFQRHYMGNFDDVVDAICELSPYFRWTTELSDWAHARGLDGLVDLDHEKLTDRAYEWWRVAETEGRTYVFAR